MRKTSVNPSVTEFRRPSAASMQVPAAMCVELQQITSSGELLVMLRDGQVMRCDVLEGCVAHGLVPGDALLVLPLANEVRGVVLGRIGRYSPPQPQPTVTIEATESLTLKCGEASVDLRADGKVMVRGEDVLLRAKGTQRIRAGNVAIN